MGVRTSGWEKRVRTDADFADARVLNCVARRSDAWKSPTREIDLWGTLGKTNCAETPTLRENYRLRKNQRERNLLAEIRGQAGFGN